jgi:peptidoglycan/xylan/chitin deacetylase (PgdA/CDA1 family)
VRAILTYHSVDASRSVISVHPDRFASHVRWLASGRVRVVSVSELIENDGREPAVALTFDDAFANFATVAWPLLRAHHLPATVFVPTGFVGGANSWAEMPGGRMTALPLCDWATLARLGEEGVTLGAHTRTHPDLRRLDASALADEIGGSIEDIRRETGQTADGFAYPYGYVDARVAGAARGMVRWACTTALSPLRGDDDPLRLPRLDSYFLQGPGRLDAFGSATFRAYMRLRALIRTIRGR